MSSRRSFTSRKRISFWRDVRQKLAQVQVTAAEAKSLREQGVVER